MYMYVLSRQDQATHTAKLLRACFTIEITNTTLVIFEDLFESAILVLPSCVLLCKVTETASATPQGKRPCPLQLSGITIKRMDGQTIKPQ